MFWENKKNVFSLSYAELTQRVVTDFAGYSAMTFLVYLINSLHIISFAKLSVIKNLKLSSRQNQCKIVIFKFKLYLGAIKPYMKLY